MSPRRHVKTLHKRGIGFDDGARIFAGRIVLWQDARRDYGEERFRAMGESEGDVQHVVFTWCDDTVRIISVRRVNQSETKLWLSHGRRST
ncbi:MAG: BrnT family toxin [Acetobacteraceae bacterium]|nr:BrnT family toxin [Acetobacteraceae bacterium]